MSAIIWLLIIAAFILAFVGLVVPVIPGILLMWIGFFLYHFMIDDSKLSWFFWIVMMILTIATLVSDYVAGSYFVKRYGGSKAGEITAAVGVIVGSFVIPPFGVIIVPLIAVLLIELIMLKDPVRAVKASIGSLFGFLASTLAKFLILLIMVIWFLIAINV
ncbi:DUF456 domain-containing protein [Macrococcus equipercicus]|uniref:DUF456 domain-containing protein n=1 Tax=Macrococcus equipercicus TaxID=69967 RepID=A0A9Q9BRH5_9STAP|nr:DUF456 domain-containing protein [Macrococcus equipercicus]KAA1042385.1 DUF456 domain-containing protein [Macrococcus equipercicus]UTH14269.1 DUF456 domain-containing protein [Macrococcus equipercicus]